VIVYISIMVGGPHIANKARTMLHTCAHTTRSHYAHTTLAEQDMATQISKTATECVMELTQATNSVVRTTCMVYNTTNEPQLSSETTTTQYIPKKGHSHDERRYHRILGYGSYGTCFSEPN
jgi:hypothetical protein